MSWTITADEEGVVVLAEDAATPIDPASFEVETVVVVGGAIDVAITRPGLPFTIRIHTPDLAALWLPFVVGEGAADALAAGDPGPVTISSGHLTGVVRRFALGMWLRRWWIPTDWTDPDSTRSPAEWLLDAELGMLAHAGSSLFGSEDVAAALLSTSPDELGIALQQRIGRHFFDAPLGSLDPARVSDAVRDDRVAEITAAGVAALLDLDVLADDTAERLHAAESAYWDALEGLTAKALDDWRDTVLHIEKRREFLAFSLGDENKPEYVELDPRELHPRSIRADDFAWWSTLDTIHVEILTYGAGSIAVDPGELFARVAFRDEVYAIPLEATPRGFTGSRAIASSLSVPDDEIAVSIYSDRYSSGGRVLDDARSSEQVRTLIAEIAVARAAAAESGVDVDYSDPSAPFAFELEYAEA